MDWTIEPEVEQLRSAQYRLQVAGFKPASVCVVLGSGLRDFAGSLRQRIVVPFNEIPEFPKTRVIGHQGEVIQGRIGDTLVHCLSGRVHIYEGWHTWQVVRAVRTLALIGTKTFVLTNAAGGIREDLVPGDVMLISDHINLTGRNVLRGDHHDCLGPRFPPMSEVYSKQARALLQRADGDLKEGVYCQVSGPSYETPAEVRMIALLGADAVGMSTVPEAVAVHAMGCRVVGVSLITNKAAGMTDGAPSHDEVIAQGQKAAKRIDRLLRRAVPLLAKM